MKLSEAKSLPLAPEIDHKVVRDLLKENVGLGGLITGTVVARKKIKEHFGEDTEFFTKGGHLTIALVRERLRIEIAF